MLWTLTSFIGFIALVTTTSSLALDIALAVELPKTARQRISAIIASTLLLIDTGALSFSILRSFRKHDQDEKVGQEGSASIIILAALAVGFFFALATTLATLIWSQTCVKDLPVSILGSSLRDILAAAFTLFGIFALFQSLYLVLLGVQARQARIGMDSVHADSEQTVVQRTEAPLGQYSEYKASSSPSSPGSLSPDFKRSDSDASSSIRSYLSHSIRPTTSRTRLLIRFPSTKSARSSLKGSQDAHSVIDTSFSTAEDGFDSWDTSAVSQDSRQTISDSAPQLRFQSVYNHLPVPFTISLPHTLPHSHSRTPLETIPASPIVSRTPSPAFALDCPTKPVSPYLGHRSRSHSPANSVRSSTSNRRRSTLPDPAEAHIHPLFRSDSPTPPPAVSTPGTSVTAAPRAGHLITESDRASLRRWRSDDWPTTSPQVSSPLVRLKSSQSTKNLT